MNLLVIIFNILLFNLFINVRWLTISYSLFFSFDIGKNNFTDVMTNAIHKAGYVRSAPTGVSARERVCYSAAAD